MKVKAKNSATSKSPVFIAVLENILEVLHTNVLILDICRATTNLNTDYFIYCGYIL